jgi:hypothetical protein
VTNLSHTAALRSPTGLDEGARRLILNIVGSEAEVPAKVFIALLFRDRFGTYQDYYNALENVHDWSVRRACEEAHQGAAEEARHNFVVADVDEPVAVAVLLAMPEHDFMLAVEEVVAASAKGRRVEPRIAKVLQTRGVPYTFDAEQGFRWAGDTATQEQLVEPALAAINDARFAGGVRDEFEHARDELRHGTANGRKKAVHEAGCAVESAMKVVLDQNRIAYNPHDNAKSLFDLLESAGLVPRFMEPKIFAVITPRNKTAGHGGGAEALDPGEAEAASVVAASAGAIAYLHTKLP